MNASARAGRATVDCPICHERRSTDEMVPGSSVRSAVQELIRREHPDWTGDTLCLVDLHRFRLAYLQSLLVTQRGELSELDQEVVESIRRNELIAHDVNQSAEARMTLGERVADRVAAFGGSWVFIGSFGAVILGWILINTVLLLRRPFDPSPSSCSTWCCHALQHCRHPSS